MSIFNTIGRLTYKTQRLVTDSTIEPVKALREGYSQAKSNQLKIEEATEQLTQAGVKITPSTFKSPSQLELDL